MPLLVIIERRNLSKELSHCKENSMKLNGKWNVLLAALIAFSVNAQQKDKTLVTIDGQEISVGRFMEVYEKNLSLVSSEEEKELAKNLDLYINYRLKVNQAFRLKLDTLKSYQREIESYKNQLYTPYLKDQKILDSLILEAYNRSKLEVKASHILVRLPQKPLPKDTLKSYEKIMKARQQILDGEDFEKVAKKVSEDRSAARNGGNLGYFSAFKMVKDFEDAAFQTQQGSVSMPFRTRFGYHILKVFDVRPSQGEVEVAHILITGDLTKGKKKIDSVYNLVKKGANFGDLAKVISNDIQTKKNGGRLPKFGSGRMIPEFEKAAFALDSSNTLSQPFKTRFGWHLIQLVKKYPITSLQASKPALQEKLKKSGRYSISRNLMIKKLRKRYTIKENKAAQSIFNSKKIRTLPKDSLQEMLFSINDRKFLQADFVAYLINRRHKPIVDLYQMYIDQEVLNYYKDDLVNTEPEFARTLSEYEEGLLLFELMQRKVWNKSTDSLGLTQFYELQKAKYKKPLDSIKGLVINDYQKQLESDWVTDLRKKSKVIINKRRFKKLQKAYAKKD